MASWLCSSQQGLRQLTYNISEAMLIGVVVWVPGQLWIITWRFWPACRALGPPTLVPPSSFRQRRSCRDTLGRGNEPSTAKRILTPEQPSSRIPCRLREPHTRQGSGRLCTAVLRNGQVSGSPSSNGSTRCPRWCCCRNWLPARC